MALVLIDLRPLVPLGRVLDRERMKVQSFRYADQLATRAIRDVDPARLVPQLRELFRRTFDDSLASDGLGLGTRREGDRIRFAYPVTIAVSSKPAPA